MVTEHRSPLQDELTLYRLTISTNILDSRLLQLDYPLSLVLVSVMAPTSNSA